MIEGTNNKVQHARVSGGVRGIGQKGKVPRSLGEPH